MRSLWTYKTASIVNDELDWPPEAVALQSTPGGLDVSESEGCTLGALPVGARLILRCRKDWRDATIVAVAGDAVTLSVTSPTGRTYRLRRPTDAPLFFDGPIPILGEGLWRAGFARYDTRW